MHLLTWLGIIVLFAVGGGTLLSLGKRDEKQDMEESLSYWLKREQRERIEEGRLL